ncbi:DNA-damage repair protein MucB [Mycoplasmopsis californica HAZ160_1]|uniref:DNA-damage repair protein MucB n=1 Tax=Mycoplasmopsis californica HAZ160_1 TaxID=1397850 RepID=A0AAT9F7K8_9BACT|nr:DNA polymerase IV [Mycoplasmopsis californica]BAP00877.1 DNA-damage repair protein MucB [Mycoplasmopsis californica HAZ160_1]BBG42513.1 DNA-damage repair protein MucB [Mycoplasmopsis californica]BBG43087.1 DNA-damage repair protein MucB [Mycoplasmopsis californica]
MSKDKIIFHMDFDSYFASAHRVINPQYDNKPIAIGRKRRRSIACSVSYELKTKGVKSGWPNFKILQVEPRTIFIEPNFDLYINLSNKIFNFIAQKYTKKIEVYSIDECWMDVSDICDELSARQLARQIQVDIKQKFRIPVSIGVSYNKFLAKISTNLAKPYGILQTTKEHIEQRIWPLEIEEYFGIGKSTAKKLRSIGIDTIGKLAHANKDDIEIYEIFRSQTRSFIQQAKGEGSDNLNYEHNELKSIGNELTFLSVDLDDRNEILKILYKLCEKVSLRAQNRNLRGYVITLSIRSLDRAWKRKQISLKTPINNVEEIYDEGVKIFNKLFNDQLIRGIGIKLSSLVNELDLALPQSLFDNNIEQKSELKNLVDKINLKIKKKSLSLGNEFAKDVTKNSIHTRFMDEDKGGKV